MNILLDYFFPITSIEPTPQAATGFLKQALVLVKVTGEVTPNVIVLCTSMSAVNAMTSSTDVRAEIQQLFNAGMNKVYVLPIDDIAGDLPDALDGHAEFFTILVSSDFDDSDVGQDVATPAVAAYLAVGDLTFTAKKAGLLGNEITIALVDDADLGEEYAHAVDKDIVVHMSDGNSTSQMIKDAIDDSISAAALVTVVIATGQESVPQDAAAEAPLAHGAAAIKTDGTGIQVGTFKGVVGVSSEDGDFEEDQAAISNRSVFHTNSTNKAKNMFYAFGKLLSNALNWRNQQYIPMPFADDIDTLGDANTLFDNKVNFVISDDEFGERLGLFAVGGKAIVAPYIKRNLQLDFQSAALTYISGNEPGYTKKEAALLEDELQKVIQHYIYRKWNSHGT
jgi:hypothetical protein